jgi:hypothetical protein
MKTIAPLPTATIAMPKGDRDIKRPNLAARRLQCGYDGVFVQLERDPEQQRQAAQRERRIEGDVAHRHAMQLGERQSERLQDRPSGDEA